MIIDLYIQQKDIKIPARLRQNNNTISNYVEAIEERKGRGQYIIEADSLSDAANTIAGMIAQEVCAAFK